MEGQKHTAELKPCPFCGCQPELNRLQFIRCSNKDCIMRDMSGMVASSWNARAESGLVKELVTALNMVNGRCTPEAQLVVDAALAKAKPAAEAA